MIFGLQESENDDVKIKEILQSIECTNIEPERAKRLGKAPDNPTVAPGDGNARNRPLLLTLKSRVSHIGGAWGGAAPPPSPKFDLFPARPPLLIGGGGRARPLPVKIFKRPPL